MIDTNHKLSNRFFFVNNDTGITPSANDSRMIPMSRLIAMSIITDTNFRILFDDSGVDDQLFVKFEITSGKGKEVMKDIVDAMNSNQRVVTLADRSTGESISSHYDKGEVVITGGVSGTFALSGALTVAGASEFNGGIKGFIKSTATGSILAADSGKTHIVGPLAGGLAADSTFTLPTPVNGLFYRFLYVGGAQDAEDFTLDTGATANFFIGGVGQLDYNSGASGDELRGVISSNNSSHYTLTIYTPSSGTWVEVYCDGTNWFISGMIATTENTLAAFAG